MLKHRRSRKKRVRLVPPRRATTGNAATMSYSSKKNTKSSPPRKAPSMKRSWTHPSITKHKKEDSHDPMNLGCEQQTSSPKALPTSRSSSSSSSSSLEATNSSSSFNLLGTSDIAPTPPQVPVDDFGELDIAHSEFIDDAIGDPEGYGVQITTENYDHVLKALANNPTITAVSLPRELEDERKMMKIFEVLETMESLYILSLYPFCNSLCKEVMCEGLTRMILNAPLRYLSIEGSSWECCRDSKSNGDDDSGDAYDEKGFDDVGPPPPQLSTRLGINSPPSTPALGMPRFRNQVSSDDFEDGEYQPMSPAGFSADDYSPPLPSSMTLGDDEFGSPPPPFNLSPSASLYDQPPPQPSQKQTTFRPKLPPMMPTLGSFGRSQSSYETKPSNRRLSSTIRITPPLSTRRPKRQSMKKSPPKPRRLLSEEKFDPLNVDDGSMDVLASSPVHRSVPCGTATPFNAQFSSDENDDFLDGDTASSTLFKMGPSFSSMEDSLASPPFPSMPDPSPKALNIRNSQEESVVHHTATHDVDEHCSSGFCMNSTLLEVLAKHKSLEHIRLCCCPASFSFALKIISKPTLKEIILSLSFPGREIFNRAERISKALQTSKVSHVTLCYMAHENIAETFIDALKTNYNILTFDIKPPELDLSMSLQMPMLQLQRTTGYIRVDRQQEVEIDKLIARNVDFAKRDRVLILRERAGLVSDVANIVVDFLFGETKRKPKRSF